MPPKASGGLETGFISVKLEIGGLFNRESALVINETFIMSVCVSHKENKYVNNT